jgi:hypothetical protein
MDVKTVIEKKTDSIKETIYQGEYRILNSKAFPIERTLDGRYKPKDDDEIACLEHQVKQGRITKKIM